MTFSTLIYTGFRPTTTLESLLPSVHHLRFTFNSVGKRTEEKILCSAIVVCPAIEELEIEGEGGEEYWCSIVPYFKSLRVLVMHKPGTAQVKTAKEELDDRSPLPKQVRTRSTSSAISHSDHSMIVSERARAARLANACPRSNASSSRMEHSGAVYIPLFPPPDPRRASHSTISSWRRSIAMLFLLRRRLRGKSGLWQRNCSWRERSTSTLMTVTITIPCSINRVWERRVARYKVVKNRSKLTFKVLERWWWRWCSIRYASFSLLSVFNVLMLLRRSSAVAIKTYRFAPNLCLYFYLYLSLPSFLTRGFIPNNCMLSSKTLNICPVSFKSNYAKSRRRPGSKTSLWSSPSCSCFMFSVNVRSMMPSPEDVRQLRGLKKTFCTIRVPAWRELYFPVAWPPSGDSRSVSRLSSAKHDSLPRPPLILVYARSLILIGRRLGTFIGEPIHRCGDIMMTSNILAGAYTRSRS